MSEEDHVVLASLPDSFEIVARSKLASTKDGKCN